MTTDTYWFAGCVPNEGDFIVFGPYETRDLAEEECNTGCDNAHLVSATVGPSIVVHVPCIYYEDEEPARCATWRWDHNDIAHILRDQHAKEMASLDVDMTPAFQEQQ